MTSTSASGNGRARSESKRGRSGKFTKKEEAIHPDVLVAQRLEEAARLRQPTRMEAFMQAARDSEEKE